MSGVRQGPAILLFHGAEVDLRAVPEAVDGVFREVVIPLSGLHLPVHAPVGKDVLEDGKENFKGGNSFLLVRATAGEQSGDAEPPNRRMKEETVSEVLILSGFCVSIAMV